MSEATETKGSAARQLATSFIAHDAKMIEIVALLRRLADAPTNVLISGESGTGKDLAASALHYWGKRSDQPLVRVDLPSVPGELMESELFGYERGAFTGATEAKPGKLELAAEGTVFLDQIGEPEPALQAKLLRVVEDKTFERVGGTRTLTLGARIVASSTADLMEAVERNSFRRDLFHRLSVFWIQLPPLRERREDIAPLASFLLARRSVAAGRLPMRFSREAMRLLEEARWEGNVRQLINVIDYVVALCEPSIVDARSLPEEYWNPRRGADGERRSRYQVGERGDAEAALIRSTLEVQGFHRQRTADALGMDRVTLYRKIREYRIVLPSGGERDETG
jgi:DNA-binding NtrC family response regulator